LINASNIGVVLVMAVGVALVPPSYPARANPADDAPAVLPDGPSGANAEITQLIKLTEIQVAEGRVWSPAGDNALETVRRILELIPGAAPETLQEVNALPSRLRERAAIEDAAGRAIEARRFAIFADSLGPVGAIAPPAARTLIARPAQSAPDGTDSAAQASPAPTVERRAAVASVADPPRLPAPAPVPALPDETLAPEVVAALMRRGDAMLAVGDISAARLLYERAALAGNAAAATAFGRTHDPEVLARIGARGIRADPAAAANWYRRAVTLGDTEAAQRLQRLEAEGPR
jgi:hypothetical protein